MKTRLRNIMIVIITLVVIQSITYYQYGRKTIAYEYFDEIENYNYHKEVLGIFDDSYSLKEKNEIEKRLLRRYKSVQFISDDEEYSNNYRVDETNWGLRYEILHSFLYIATVTEESGTRYYGEEWETKLVWCFGVWIRYKHECISQS